MLQYSKFSAQRNCEANLQTFGPPDLMGRLAPTFWPEWGHENQRSITRRFNTAIMTSKRQDPQPAPSIRHNHGTIQISCSTDRLADGQNASNPEPSASRLHFKIHSINILPIFWDPHKISQNGHSLQVCRQNLYVHLSSPRVSPLCNHSNNSDTQSHSIFHWWPLRVIKQYVMKTHGKVKLYASLTSTGHTRVFGFTEQLLFVGGKKTPGTSLGEETEWMLSTENERCSR